MFVMTLILALMLVLTCISYLRLKRCTQQQKKLHAELHDRYLLLWDDYIRRGQRIMLYESGMSKEDVDALDSKVLARAEKFAKNNDKSE